ncbi:MAG: hypothetical protein H5U37_03270 [Caldisericia bacterium]|nr:hypothetical protein [Caldisericia bacterium]
MRKLNYINIKVKIKLNVKKLIIILSIIFISFLIIFILREYYYNHWKIVYYGESENFEGEFLLLPSKIEKEVRDKLKKDKLDIIPYYCELWIKTKNDINETFKVESKDNFENFSFDKEIKLENKQWQLIYKTFIGYEKNYKFNKKDYKVILNIEYRDGEKETLEIKFLTNFPFLYKAPFLPPCKSVIFNPFDPDIFLP